MDYSPPGSSADGIFQARVLKWVAISFSRGSSWPNDQTCLLHWQADSLPLSHQRNLVFNLFSLKAYYTLKEAQWAVTLSFCLSGLRFILPLPLVSCVTLDKYVISLCLRFPHKNGDNNVTIAPKSFGGLIRTYKGLGGWCEPRITLALSSCANQKQPPGQRWKKEADFSESLSSSQFQGSSLGSLWWLSSVFSTDGY